MKRDWQETITVAADVALIGLATTVASVPLVTLGAALRTGSAAIHCVAVGEKVSLPAMWRLFRASLLRGCAASLAVFALILLLAFNVGAVSDGRVPGGSPALAGTGAAVVVLLAIGMLSLVHLGRDKSRSSWREALRWSARTAWRQPGAAAAVAGVSAVAAALALFVPLTAPLLVGFALYAAHAVTTRFVKSPSPA